MILFVLYHHNHSIWDRVTSWRYSDLVLILGTQISLVSLAYKLIADFNTKNFSSYSPPTKMQDLNTQFKVVHLFQIISWVCKNLLLEANSGPFIRVCCHQSDRWVALAYSWVPTPRHKYCCPCQEEFCLSSKWLPQSRPLKNTVGIQFDLTTAILSHHQQDCTSVTLVGFPFIVSWHTVNKQNN